MIVLLRILSFESRVLSNELRTHNSALKTQPSLHRTFSGLRGRCKPGREAEQSRYDPKSGTHAEQVAGELAVPSTLAGS